MSKLKTFYKIFKLIDNLDEYLINYFNLQNKNKEFVIYKLNNGIKYKCRTGNKGAGRDDSYVIREIWLHNEYEKYFKIKENDIVVDLGSHIGIFSIFASTKTKNKIYAFEPSKNSYKLLIENIKINKINNIIPSDNAVTSMSGIKEFLINSDFMVNVLGSYQKNYQRTEEDKRVKIKSIAFKDFLKKVERIDFLKIDVEGWEFDILYSLDNKDYNKINKIAMEVHNIEGEYGKNITYLKEFLKDKGFNIKTENEDKPYLFLYAIKEEGVFKNE